MKKGVKVAFIDNSIDSSIYNPEEHWKPYLDAEWDSFKATKNHFPDLKKGYTHLLLTGSEASIVERENWVYEEALKLTPRDSGLIRQVIKNFFIPREID